MCVKCQGLKKLLRCLNTLTKPLPPSFLQALSQIYPKSDCLTDAADCWAYAYDNSRHHHPPQAVVFATNEQQIIATLTLCNQYVIPIVPRGKGTGTTGASVPIKAGLVLSLERMNQIIKIDPDNRLLIAQAGVTNQMIQQTAKQHGFFWPPDPTSSAVCTLGGNLAYNSAGPRAVKYGTPRENTLGLEAITATGKKIQTGVCTTKGVVGYDLTRLLIGSEGTLAMITQATLKLTPLAETITTIRAIYQNIETAAKAVVNIMAQAITPCALEFMDAQAIAMIQSYSQANLPKTAGALLMIEVDGSKTEVPTVIEAIRKAAQNQGLLEFLVATKQQEVQALWQTRKALSPALKNIAPKKINEDVVVPVANVPKLLTGLAKLSQQYNITIVNFGHIGNGNIHVNLLTNPDDQKEQQRASQCLTEVFDLVLSLNGSLSGEHGVGIEKQAFVGKEIEPNALALMQQIKQLFDPNNILNPNKMFPLN